MSCRVILAFGSIAMCIASLPCKASETMSLAEVLTRAERFSPDVKAAEQGEQAAQQGLRVAESYYYPTLDLTAVDSTGFPASANAPIGFNGLMSSPYRVGLSGGAYTTFTFFDLTREYGVKAADYGVKSAQEEQQVRRLNTDLRVMNLYIDAVLNLTQRQTWEDIQAEINRLYSTVKKYVRNGQYSEVTLWLLQNQVERAKRKQDEYGLAYEAAVRKIEINIGAPEGTVGVEGVAQLEQTLTILSQHRAAESPYVAEPKVQVQVSKAAAERQSAENWPRLMGIASAGEMQNSRLVPTQNYAAWVGLTFPIFEGFRISAATAQARALEQKNAELLNQAQIELADSDVQFTQQALSREKDVLHLKSELDDAQKALKLAEHRYITFVGDLADVRDSLNSYEEAESSLNIAQTEVFRSKLSQAIVDGGYLPQSEKPGLN